MRSIDKVLILHKSLITKAMTNSLRRGTATSISGGTHNHSQVIEFYYLFEIIKFNFRY